MLFARVNRMIFAAAERWRLDFRTTDRFFVSFVENEESKNDFIRVQHKIERLSFDWNYCLIWRPLLISRNLYSSLIRIHLVLNWFRHRLSSVSFCTKFFMVEVFVVKSLHYSYESRTCIFGSIWAKPIIITLMGYLKQVLHFTH